MYRDQPGADAPQKIPVSSPDISGETPAWFNYIFL